MVFFDRTSYYYVMVNSTLTRKEREYLHREQLILDTARNILATDGYQMFSMERIASEIEYSKGTIYNHFKSKEDILSSLCCDSLEALSLLFERAKDYDACSRDKISALILAYALHAKLRPVDVQNMQSIKSQVVREKVSQPLSEKMDLAEQKVIEPAKEIVMYAIHQGDLQIESEEAAGEMITGMWSLGYGTFLLSQTQIDFNSLGLALPEKQFLNNAQKLLDGYHWKPLSNKVKLEEYYLKIGKEVFPEEFKTIKTM